MVKRQSCGTYALWYAIFLLQIAQLRYREHAILAWTQPVNREPSEVGAHEPHHRIPNCLRKPADLPVLALVQPELEPGLSVLDPQDPNVDRLRGSALDDDGLLEPQQAAFAHFALHLCNVDFLDPPLGVEQTHREVPIVRKQQHTAGRVVEPSNRDETRGYASSQCRHRLSPLGVMRRTDETAGLMQQDVDGWFIDHSRTVDLDPLPVTVGFGAKLRDDATIDADPTGQNQLFRLAPRGNPGASKDLLQSVWHDRTRTSLTSG
jgi:hypothetical protein